MPLDDDPQWYKDAIIYELHVRAFHDSDGDGIGDFKGLTQRLDYLQDLGVTALWLLPFYPSPLKDDGYDIANYTDVHPHYGSLEDFQEFLHEAHRRGLRVITELVINHTSDQHAWFQRARRAPEGSPERDFYVWSDTPERYEQARIIFQDFETSNWAWDPVAKAYYWHRFYSNQPDLNFDNPAVHEAIFEVLDFWLDMGVDGLRLDAVPYLYEREGTNCENLPETHAYLKKLRAHVDENYDDRMLLAEANQWPEDAAEYFGDGDECHMNFHFPVMPRLYLALQQEDRFGIVDIMEQTPDIPDSSQWAVFLRNHDELTLEMVTDEERDFMYRAYAREARARINLGIRRRLAPLMENDRRRIELMNALLFSLPGTPVLYYGDEIGMGDNIFLGDRHGVRTPMQWNGDRNAGFSRTNPQKLFQPTIIDPEYHYEAVNVEVQQSNPSSLLWWMKRLIALRNRHPAFARGEIRFLRPDNRKVLVFLREYDDEQILVVANLSRHTEYCELDLGEFAGQVPVELFGHNVFPPIGDLPYFLTLGPHSVYWFSLETHGAARRPWDIGDSSEPVALEMEAVEDWSDLLGGDQRDRLEQAIAGFVRRQRWYRSKGTLIRNAAISSHTPLRYDGQTAQLTRFEIENFQNETETYMLPLAYATGEQADAVLKSGYPVIARLDFGPDQKRGLIYDAVADPMFAKSLLDVFSEGARGLHATTTPVLADCLDDPERLAPRVMQAEQTNTSIVYGDRLILKLYRKVEPGANLEAEVGQFLTDVGFEHAPRLAGSLEFGDPRRQTSTLAILQEYVDNEGDAWDYTLDELDRYFERVLSAIAPTQASDAAATAPPSPDDPAMVRELAGGYVDAARTLGRRTAQMHKALASRPEDPQFAPVEFSKLYQRSLYQSARNLTGRVFDEARRLLDELPDDLAAEVQRVINAREPLLEPFRRIIDSKMDAWRIRCHGDYHLGQVLYTGRDFVITDFEGEPARPASERRIKRSPLRDVAGMIRSFHYAAFFALAEGEHADLASDHGGSLERWADAWFQRMRQAYVDAYLDEAGDSRLLPDDPEEVERLLEIFEIEKAVYELGYEINNRPDWVQIPLRGIEYYLASAD